jgi:hypothetical protein
MAIVDVGPAEDVSSKTAQITDERQSKVEINNARTTDLGVAVKILFSELRLPGGVR